MHPSPSFNKISIFEYKDTKELPDGFSQVRLPRIQEYSVDAWLNGQWQTIYVGQEPMGDCKVIRLVRSYRSSMLRLRITKATAPPSIYAFHVTDREKGNNS